MEDNNNLEISKVQLPNGDVYNIKDQYIRDELEKLLGSDYFKNSKQDEE